MWDDENQLDYEPDENVGTTTKSNEEPYGETRTIDENNARWKACNQLVHLTPGSDTERKHMEAKTEMNALDEVADGKDETLKALRLKLSQKPADEAAAWRPRCISETDGNRREHKEFIQTREHFWQTYSIETASEAAANTKGSKKRKGKKAKYSGKRPRLSLSKFQAQKTFDQQLEDWRALRYKCNIFSNKPRALASIKVAEDKISHSPVKRKHSPIRPPSPPTLPEILNATESATMTSPREDLLNMYQTRPSRRPKRSTSPAHRSARKLKRMRERRYKFVSAMALKKKATSRARQRAAVRASRTLKPRRTPARFRSTSPTSCATQVQKTRSNVSSADCPPGTTRKRCPSFHDVENPPVLAEQQPHIVAIVDTRAQASLNHSPTTPRLCVSFQDKRNLKLLAQQHQHKVADLRQRMANESNLDPLVKARIVRSDLLPLSPEDFETVRQKILGRIVLLQRIQRPSPIFYDVVQNESHINIVCTREDIVNCLQPAVEDMNAEKFSYAIVEDNRNNVYVNGINYQDRISSELFIQQLSVVYPQLRAERWVVVGHEICARKNMTFIVILIDEASILVLEHLLHNRVFIGIARASFENRVILPLVDK